MVVIRVDIDPPGNFILLGNKESNRSTPALSGQAMDEDLVHLAFHLVQPTQDYLRVGESKWVAPYIGLSTSSKTNLNTWVHPFWRFAGGSPDPVIEMIASRSSGLKYSARGWDKKSTSRII